MGILDQEAHDQKSSLRNDQRRQQDVVLYSCSSVSRSVFIIFEATLSLICFFLVFIKYSHKKSCKDWNLQTFSRFEVFTSIHGLLPTIENSRLLKLCNQWSLIDINKRLPEPHAHNILLYVKFPKSSLFEFKVNFNVTMTSG